MTFSRVLHFLYAVIAIAFGTSHPDRHKHGSKKHIGKPLAAEPNYGHSEGIVEITDEGETQRHNDPDDERGDLSRELWHRTDVMDDENHSDARVGQESDKVDQNDVKSKSTSIGHAGSHKHDDQSSATAHSGVPREVLPEDTKDQMHESLEEVDIPIIYEINHTSSDNWEQLDEAAKKYYENLLGVNASQIFTAKHEYLHGRGWETGIEDYMEGVVPDAPSRQKQAIPTPGPWIMACLIIGTIAFNGVAPYIFGLPGYGGSPSSS